MPGDEEFCALVDIVEDVLRWLGSLLGQASVYNAADAAELARLQDRMDRLVSALNTRGR